MKEITIETKEILKNIKNFFFDVDGTLFSSENMLEEVYQEAIISFFKKKQISKKPPTIKEIMKYIGLPVKEIFKNLLPDISEKEREEISTTILKSLVLRIQKGEGHHYEGTKEVIEYLYKKGYQLFTASNGRRPYIEAILKANHIDSYFLEIPAIDNQKIFNKSQIVASIISQYSLNPGECVMIGDRDSDRKAALDNHIFFIAASYGHGNPEERKGALLYLDSIKEILQYF